MNEFSQNGSAVLLLNPAYGKNYTNSNEALNDWAAGKDFICHDSRRYTSIRDIELLKETYTDIYLTWKIVSETTVKTVKIL